MSRSGTLESGWYRGADGAVTPSSPRCICHAVLLERLRGRFPGVSGIDTEIPAPFDRYRTVVRPEWIDHNGHMNMGFYLVVFDLATDAVVSVPRARGAASNGAAP